MMNSYYIVCVLFAATVAGSGGVGGGLVGGYYPGYKGYIGGAGIGAGGGGIGLGAGSVGVGGIGLGAGAGLGAGGIGIGAGGAGLGAGGIGLGAGGAGLGAGGIGLGAGGVGLGAGKFIGSGIGLGGAGLGGAGLGTAGVGLVGAGGLGAGALSAGTLGAGGLGAGTLGAGSLGVGGLGAGGLGVGSLGAGGLGAGGLGVGGLGAGGLGVGGLGAGGLGAGGLGAGGLGVGGLGAGGLGVGGIGAGGLGAGTLGVGAIGAGGGLGGGLGGGYVNKNLYSGENKNINGHSLANIHANNGAAGQSGAEGFSHGEAAVKDIKGNNGFYSDQQGGKKVLDDGKSFSAGQHFNEAGGKGEGENSNVNHKKGHVTKGYKSSHHKDESGESETYYDEANDEGGKFFTGGSQGSFGKHGQSAFKGVNENGQFAANQGGKQGHFNQENILDKGNVGKGQFGQKGFHSGGQVFSLNNGAGEQAVLGRQDANGLYLKHYPHAYAPYYG